MPNDPQFPPSATRHVKYLRLAYWGALNHPEVDISLGREVRRLTQCRCRFVHLTLHFALRWSHFMWISKNTEDVRCKPQWALVWSPISGLFDKANGLSAVLSLPGD